MGLESSVTKYVCILSFVVGTPLPISVFYVYVRGPWYFFTTLLHFTSSKSNRNKARSMPQELWVTNTNFGGRSAEAAVAVKFVHKRIPRQKTPRKTGKCGGGGGREVVSDRAYNISPFFTLQVREKRVLPFNRHTRHGCVFLEEVCRTIDNTSVLVLKMLVVCTEAHV